MTAISLQVKGRMGGKACVVTTDTGASVTTARQDIRAGLLEIDPPTKCPLQMASEYPPHFEGSFRDNDYRSAQ
jgi:hypothetical protein